MVLLFQNVTGKLDISIAMARLSRMLFGVTPSVRFMRNANSILTENLQP